MADQMFNLDELVEGPTVSIDGQAYPLAGPHALSPLEMYRNLKAARRLQALIDKAELTEAEEAELGQIPDQVCRAVLDAPDAVHARLTDRQRMKVIELFSTLSRAPHQAPAGATPTASTGARTGASSSPPSATGTPAATP